MNTPGSRRRMVLAGVVAALVVPALVAWSLKRDAERTDFPSRVPLSTIGIGRPGSAPAATPAPHKPIGPVDPHVRNRLDSLEHRLESHPDDDGARLSLARILEDSHRLPRAIETYRAYLAGSPDDTDAWLDLGRTLAASGDLDGAEAAMESVLARDPSNPSALYNMGAIAANQGRLDEAETVWRRLIDEAPDSRMAELAATSLGRLPRAR